MNWHVLIYLLAVVLLTSSGLSDPVPTTIDDFFMPGSQPLESGTFRMPTQCDNCHGGYDLQTEIAHIWRGNMMAQAARDPLFYATMTISNQDAPDAGDLCMRCHTPTGWLEGRSEPTDGSGLISDDRNSIHCSFCHRAVAPGDIGENPYPDDSTYTADTYPLDQQYLSSIGDIPPTDGNGMYVIDELDDKRGPYVETVARHSTLYSPYHSDSRICGNCHDVSNPVFTHSGGRDYVPNAFGQPADNFNPYSMFPVERTYSEWLNSDYNTPGGVYAPQFGGNLDYVSSCQDCHMKDVTGYGADMNNAPLRDDLPWHDMMGGNTFAPLLVLSAFPGEVDSAALYDAIDRATYMLQNAASMSLVTEEVAEGWSVEVTVTNETGHKLPSGYPEGRRIWLRVTATDEYGDTLYQSGAYDHVTAVLTHDDDIKVYEIQHGISTSLAPVVNLPAEKSFHFVLNDTVYKDNRIPPRGFTNAAYETIGSPVAGYFYPDGQYWDVTNYLLPEETHIVQVDLLYQTTSKEFIEFLQTENVTDDWGDLVYQYWTDRGKSPPVVMQSVSDTLEATVDPGQLVLELTPHNAPITVPAEGGTFSFTAYVANETDDVLANHAWTEVLLPGGNVYGPIINAPSLNLNSGQVIELTSVSQDVPAFAPVGVYEYRAFIEDLGGEYADSASFTFEKLAARSFGQQYSSWDARGWQALLAAKGTASFTAQPAEHGAVSVYPNPFNPTTAVTIHLETAGDVKIDIYNLVGKRVTSLAHNHYVAGTHEFLLDGSKWASGVYFISAHIGNVKQVQKIMLVR